MRARRAPAPDCRARVDLDWPREEPLAEFERTLDRGPSRAERALMLAVRRAGSSADYAPTSRRGDPVALGDGRRLSPTLTAPLRRLADRYVLEAVFAVANGRPVPDAVTAAVRRAAGVDGQGASHGGRSTARSSIPRTVMLSGRDGEVFPTIVTDIDERGAHIPALQPARIVARVKRVRTSRRARRCASRSAGGHGSGRLTTPSHADRVAAADLLLSKKQRDHSQMQLSAGRAISGEAGGAWAVPGQVVR
jgi:hypothetical protein